MRLVIIQNWMCSPKRHSRYEGPEYSLELVHMLSIVIGKKVETFSVPFIVQINSSCGIIDGCSLFKSIAKVVIHNGSINR